MKISVLPMLFYANLKLFKNILKYYFCIKKLQKHKQTITTKVLGSEGKREGQGGIPNLSIVPNTDALSSGRPSQASGTLHLSFPSSLSPSSCHQFVSQ